MLDISWTSYGRSGNNLNRVMRNAKRCIKDES